MAKGLGKGVGGGLGVGRGAALPVLRGVHVVVAGRLLVQLGRRDEKRGGERRCPANKYGLLIHTASKA